MRPEASTTESPEVIVPAEVEEIALQSIGAFFEPISLARPQQSARDFLDLSKADKRIAILQRFCNLEGKRVLEVGSGFGTNLAVWLKRYRLDAYGAEPATQGFDQGYRASRLLLSANGLDPDRIVNAHGESLPFPNESFDVVYSANVLEHTSDPEQVLAESLRVLRKGGILHMEMPNFLSWFEGHYMVLQPPIFFRGLLPLWVRLVFRRDPAFARTLRTEINPVWCRRMTRRLRSQYDIRLISLGEDLFLERLNQPFVFDTQVVAGRLAGLIHAVTTLNRANWMGKLIVALQGYYPIYLTIAKS